LKQLVEASPKLAVESPSDKTRMQKWGIAGDLVGLSPTSAHVVSWLCLFSGAMSCSGGKWRSFALNLAGQFLA